MADSTIRAMDGLFTPFKVRGMELSNRIAMSPMGLGVASNGVPGPHVADYYTRRAEGGTGLILTEAAFIDHRASGDSTDLPRLFGDDAIDAWRGIVSRIHAAGGKAMAQLHHIGLIYDNRELYAGGNPQPRPHLNLVSPSGVIAPGRKVDEGMTPAQIEEVIESYGKSAETAKAIGYDGVEVHGAHGFLIDQFLWAETNQRTDNYGGDIHRRSRFAAEVVAEVRRRVGPDYPIFFRTSQFKIIDYSAKLAETPQELEAILAPLVDAGVDLFDCSQRRLWEPLFPGSDLNLAGWAKKITGKPSMTVGSTGLDKEMMDSFTTNEVAGINLRSLEALMDMFERGDFDLVAVGRALIADPNWAQLVQRREFHNLTPFHPGVIADTFSALLQA